MFFSVIGFNAQFAIHTPENGSGDLGIPQLPLSISSRGESTLLCSFAHVLCIVSSLLPRQP